MGRAEHTKYHSLGQCTQMCFEVEEQLRIMLPKNLSEIVLKEILKFTTLLKFTAKVHRE